METAQSIIDFVSQWRANNTHAIRRDEPLSKKSR